MPTTYTDQFFLMDALFPPPVGTQIDFVRYDLIDENDDGNFEYTDGDTINGAVIDSQWVGDTITLNVPGVGDITYVGVTFFLSNGEIVFTPNDGQILQNGTLVSSTGFGVLVPMPVTDLPPACFTPGTMIRTESGERLIEDLQIGDLIVTRDNGVQPILWIGRREVKAEGDFAPILFETGALGNTAPLLVSPQHRMLIEDWRAAYFCGWSEVFVQAKHLVNGTTVTQVSGGTVDYIHLLFADHEVIYSHGIPSESYFPQHAMETVDRGAQAELAVLFPHMTSLHVGPAQTAHPVSRRREAQIMTLSA